MKATVVQCPENDVLRKINFLFRKKNYKLVDEKVDSAAGKFEYNVKQKSWFFSEGFTFRLNRVSDSNMRIELSFNGGGNDLFNPIAQQKELQMMESIYRMF
ncbi:MAG: hypothetical protein ACKOQ6_05240 [Bacteroidota bacterium]